MPRKIPIFCKHQNIEEHACLPHCSMSNFCLDEGHELASLQGMEELDMQEDDAFLGEVDVDELIAQHRQKQASPDFPGRPSATDSHAAPRPQEQSRPAGVSQSIPHRGQLFTIREERVDMDGPFCSHGKNFAQCPQRWVLLISCSMKQMFLCQLYLSQQFID